MPRITKPNLATDLIQYAGQKAEFSGSTSFIEGVFIKNIEVEPLNINNVNNKPNFGDSLFFDGVKFTANNSANISNTILTGLQIKVDPTNALRFSALTGSYRLNSQTYTYTGGTILIPSGDSTNPRFDLLTIDTSKTLININGIAQASPVVPQTPLNQLLLAIIQVTPGYYSGTTGTSITNNTPSGVIGIAEDGTYTDGLFTDFIPTTTIGVPVDRFNELFKAMLPDAAPSLSNINNTTNYGASRKLSFGAGKPILNYSSVTNADGQGILDYNDTFPNYQNRKGVYNSKLTPTLKFSLNLNNDITSSYPNYSFSKGNSGLLKIELNGNTIHTLDLSQNSGVTSSISANTAIYLNNTNSLNYSLTGKKLDFDIFSYRTGYTTFNLSASTKGFNYLRVLLDTTPTNYIAWVDDQDNIDPTITNSSYYVNSLNGGYYISGIYYNTGATLSYSGNVNNCFKNTFINDLYLSASTLQTRTNTLSTGTDITTYTLTNGLFTPTATTLTSDLNSHLTKLVISGIQTTVPNTTYLQDSIIKLNLVSNNSFDNLNNRISTLDTKILSGFSIYNPTNTTGYKKETFVNETYRLNNNAFSSTYTNIDNGSLAFVSSRSIIGGTDQSNNLLQYNGRLYYPSGTTLPALGDFTSTLYFPNSVVANNKNYSTVNVISSYFRYFKKATATSNSSLQFNITSNGFSDSTDIMTTAPNSTPNANQVAIEMKIYYSNATISSVYNLFATPSTNNLNDAGYTSTPTLNSTNNFTLGTNTALSINDIIVFRIKYGTGVSGYITNIEILSDF